MGRHGKPAPKDPPDPRRFRKIRARVRRLWHLLRAEQYGWAWVRPRRLWHLLPEEWRGWIWVRRQHLRVRMDRFYGRSRLADWAKGREWEDSLPKDPANWSDAWDHLGSYGVAAHLRSHLRRRGDLLPEHHLMESK